MSPNLAFSSSTNQLLLLLYYYFQLLFKWHIFRFSYVTSPQILNKKCYFLLATGKLQQAEYIHTFVNMHRHLFTDI